METSTNINESLDEYDDYLTLEKRKKLFIGYIKDVEDGELSIPEENSFNIWTIWFNDEMNIFNITDDTKEFFKEYIKMNDKNVTQWIVYKNIMAIFNVTPKTQEVFTKYISTKNNELKDKENKESKDKKTKKSKDKKKKPSVQYYEYLNIHPKNIKTSRPSYIPENYAETEEIFRNEMQDVMRDF